MQNVLQDIERALGPAALVTGDLAGNLHLIAGVGLSRTPEEVALMRALNTARDPEEHPQSGQGGGRAPAG
ncbi:hypothetical protein [Phenylobacterium sp.]|jgi:hypothetical protein|uniref:hypothetical protein n=1 Tax=Phenylobacterium sp. TaxID=1871053 RepID=UPI002F923F04